MSCSWRSLRTCKECPRSATIVCNSIDFALIVSCPCAEKRKLWNAFAFIMALVLPRNFNEDGGIALSIIPLAAQWFDLDIDLSKYCLGTPLIKI